MDRTNARINELSGLIGIAEDQRAGLALVLGDPRAYVAQHLERLSSRGVSGVVEGLADIAFSDALLESGCGLNLDWKFDPADLPHLTSAMIGDLANELPVDEMEADENAYEALERLHSFLRDHGYTLFQVPIDGDSYEVFIVPEDKAERVDFLLAALGFGAGPFWDDAD